MCIFSSVAQSRPTLCDPLNHSTPGLHIHHQLPESTQTHVHCVGDAIQHNVCVCIYIYIYTYTSDLYLYVYVLLILLPWRTLTHTAI